jgi:arylsulfate sulfotransferase
VAALKHFVPLHGLYPGKDNKVVLRLDDQSKAVFAETTLRVQTEELPEFFPDIDVRRADMNRMEPGWTLSSFSVGDGGRFNTVPFIFDENGDIRWYMDLTFLGGMSFTINRFQNGNLRVGRGNTVFEFDQLGHEIRRWEMDGYWYHHESKEMPNGNILVAVNRQDIPTIEDHVVELNRTTGMVVRVWDLRELFESSLIENSKNPRDWFHMNAIWYDPTDDSLILSGRNQDSVIKVSGDNELIWMLAPHRDWNENVEDAVAPDMREYLLTAVDQEGFPFSKPVQQGVEDAPDFSWSWGQHASMLLPNGNLFLFDNGLNRNFSDVQPNYSRGVEYKIDAKKMTIQQIWQYGKDRGDGFYSRIVSDVDWLPNTGNRLINPGIVWEGEPYALITEVTYPEKELVFEAKLTFANVKGSLERSWGQFDLVYRSERLKMYP